MKGLQLEIMSHIRELFNFHVYRLECLSTQVCQPNGWTGNHYVEIVVLKDQIVLDTIRVDAWNMLNMPHFLLELDLGNDQLGMFVLLDGMGTQGSIYRLYLLRDGEFSHVSGNIVNPSVDVENQFIKSSVRLPLGLSQTIYQILDDELVPVELLETKWHPESETHIWSHYIFLDGEWEIFESTDTGEYQKHPDRYWQEYWFGDRWQHELSESMGTINEGD